VLLSSFQGDLLAIRVDCFGVVAESFNAVGDFNESAETGYPQDLTMQYIADVMRLEETFPNVGRRGSKPSCTMWNWFRSV
jgi:hypothetical protein